MRDHETLVSDKDTAAL